MPCEIVENSASQFRIAKAWPVADAPAFISSGRVPPWGLGLARTLFNLKKRPSKSKSSRGDQASLTMSSHSCAYA
jgi:hypothetical protein